MISQRSAALSLLAAALALAASPARAQADRFHLKPGARGKACVECHADFQDTLKLPFVHTPVRSGDCAACHNPHASSHGKLLADDPDRICSKCHAAIVPSGARSVHEAVAKGQCVKCHDPHAAKNRNNLLTAGNDLCFGCHKAVAEAAASARFKHAPAERSCLSCHDPHASTTADFLLKKGIPGVCLDCHKADQPTFVSRHMGYPVGKSRCTSCHDPHGSGNKGILWTSVHPPVASRMCAQCHLDPSSPDPLKTRKAGLDLCRGCHASRVNEMLARTEVHWPVVAGASCLNCHNPHAAKVKPLLSAAPKEVCGRCHADTIARQDKSVTKHKPVDDGDCATCHSPHAADGPFLFKTAGVIDLCGTCHDWQRHSTHPIGEKVRDMRNKNLEVDCLSCHRSHGSPYKTLAYFDTKMNLCVQCHQTLTR